jgi:hypothetical protein
MSEIQRQLKIYKTGRVTITFSILKTASAQLVFMGLRAWLGLQSQMKSTPHIFPL